MKYYFPTSTLNFDAIYSSMCIMPPCYYNEDAIWFPRYFRSEVDVSDEIFVVYSKPINWRIDDEDSENYPMLVEIDESVVERMLQDRNHVAQGSLGIGVDCIMSGVPFVFKAQDMISRKVRIVFRNDRECQSIVNRAKIGVSECKTIAGLRSLGITATSGEFLEGVIHFDYLKNDLITMVQESGLSFDKKEYDGFEREDRRAGAIAGFNAGKWIRSMREGCCLDCFRQGFEYEAWKCSLPSEFSALIDFLCQKIGFHWDVNRDAILLFCKECWHCCFEGQRGKDNVQLEKWHTILRSIAKGQTDPTFVYPVADISDGYMQAVACFINGGKRPDRLLKSILEDGIMMPELVLAFYGALVGYSIFSRIFFERRIIEEWANVKPIVQPSGMQNRVRHGEGAVVSASLQPKIKGVSRIASVDKEKLSNGVETGILGKAISIFKSSYFCDLIKKKSSGEKESLEKSLRVAAERSADNVEVFFDILRKEEGWGKRTKHYKELKSKLEDRELLLFGLENIETNKTVRNGDVGSKANNKLLIFDEGLCDAVTKEFSYLGEGCVKRLCLVLRMFAEKYHDEGYYGQHPDQYKKENPDLIDHLVKCFSARKTQELNFTWPNGAEDEEDFVTFLEQRYGCRRKQRLG